MTADEFKAWRISMGYTSQQQAADALGISKSAIEQYEFGRRRDNDQPVQIPIYIELACKALQMTRGGGLGPDERIETWHASARNKFLSLLSDAGDQSRLSDWHWQFSYAIHRSEGQEIPPGKLVDVLRRANDDVRDLVVSGWSMFYVFNREQIAPNMRVDTTSGQGINDFLECALFGGSQTGGNDLWRVSRDGLATLVRGYFEDSPELGKYMNMAPGSFLSPNWLVRDLAEFVRHARAMAGEFADATAVSFRCALHGLAGRRIASPMTMWSPGYRFDDDTVERISAGTWRSSDLESKWPEIVTSLAAPAMRAAHVDHVVTPQWVRDQTPTWRR